MPDTEALTTGNSHTDPHSALRMPFTVIAGDDGDGMPADADMPRLPDYRQRFVSGTLETVIGPVPQILSEMTWHDHWGTIRARWGAGRMNYRVDPGLYALGRPAADAPVMVSSNYKMSFDALRKALGGRDIWILVLNTQGINVWCAAGKGSFGTAELVGRIHSSGLAKLVDHRRLILPQLSAPGIAAHQVKKRSGFKVVYGPIRAIDLPYFLDNRLTATPRMRKKRFSLKERVVLIPVELVQALKAAVFVLPVLFLSGGFGGGADFWTNTCRSGLFAVLALLAAILSGTVLVPLLLPWLPGRAFSAKGGALGLAVALGMIWLRRGQFPGPVNRLELAAWFFLIPAVTAYLAMNFTGASTYTSLSGVKKEMRWAVPMEIASALTGFGLWIGSRFAA